MVLDLIHYHNLVVHIDWTPAHRNHRQITKTYQPPLPPAYITGKYWGLYARCCVASQACFVLICFVLGAFGSLWPPMDAKGHGKSHRPLRPKRVSVPIPEHLLTPLTTDCRASMRKMAQQILFIVSEYYKARGTPR